MNVNDNIQVDILGGKAVSLVIEDPDDGKLNRLANHIRNYVSDRVRSSMSIAPGTEGTCWKMVLHIPVIEHLKRPLVISALEQSKLNIHRQ
ncbi:MAG: hypothetical protein RL536_232 [Candidatus Parcubacteria bacterium]|jgi:hypothetical protein